jgi:hypothetical protein
MNTQLAGIDTTRQIDIHSLHIGRQQFAARIQMIRAKVIHARDP